VRRRDFIAGLAGFPIIPVVARAQHLRTPVIGYLGIGVPEASARTVDSFRKGLSETGYVEGKNLKIEYRWAHNKNERLSELAAELVRLRVNLIATPQGSASAIAARSEAKTTPVVFGIGNDPVEMGLVASLNRPGGNVTGVSYMQVEIASKQLDLLHQLLRSATRFALMVNPDNPSTADKEVEKLMAATAVIGGQLQVLRVRTTQEIENAFDALEEKRAQALLVSPEPLFANHRVQIVILAARYAVPAIYPSREYAEAGGLMSYGNNLSDGYRLVGVYAGRILKGDKPADLPIMRPTKFEFIINLQTAKALRIEVPPSILVSATEVIE